MLIDTHAHLDFPDFDPDRREVIARAQDAGVGAIITVGTDAASNAKAVQIAQDEPTVYAALGIHPNECASATDKDFDELKRLAGQKKVVAIGETGLDFYRQRSAASQQEAAFRRHLALARELDLPVIVHCRDAHAECLKVLSEAAPLRGVMHCFSGDEAMARRCIELGLYISFAGPVTFPNANRLRAVAKAIAADRLVLETDCPFLAPQPRRGKRNEPAYVRHTAETLAQVHGLSFDDIARVTTLNAGRVFGVGQAETQAAIVYAIRRSLYVNVTSRCSNSCVFCPRQTNPYVKGHNLRLEKDPEPEEAIAAVGDPTRYEEIVFCGLGEPTLRLDFIKAVARHVKSRGVKVRINTNGQGSLIHGRPICEELRGLVDALSVSLNTSLPDQYHKLCRPEQGAGAFPAVLAFVREAKLVIPSVSVTALDMPGVDLDACRRLTADLGVGFRLRKFDDLG